MSESCKKLIMHYASSVDGKILEPVDRTEKVRVKEVTMKRRVKRQVKIMAAEGDGMDGGGGIAG